MHKLWLRWTRGRPAHSHDPYAAVHDSDEGEHVEEHAAWTQPTPGRFQFQGSGRNLEIDSVNFKATWTSRHNDRVTDRETLRAAAQAVASVMRRRQAEHQVRTDGGWVEPDPDLLELVVECEDVIYSHRPEESDLTERLAAVLGDDWEP